MRRHTIIPALLLAMSVLTACADRPLQKLPAEAVYDSAAYELELPQSTSYELAGNGRYAVILPYSGSGGNAHGGTSIYRAALEGKTVKGTICTELERPADLLGMDREDGMWLYDGQLHRVGLDGERLTVELPHPLWENGVFGFADDGAYTYFLCSFRTPDEMHIVACDRSGAVVFSEELTAYCQGTLGYIPREADWAEELEGREEDYLLSRLFAGSPTDSVMLTQLQDGRAALTLIRKSPLDGERYCILCPIREDFSVEPAMYYSVEAEGGIPYGLPMASPEEGFDLLSPQRDGLYGIDLEAGTMTFLAGWDQLGADPDWFTGWTNSVGLGPDGRIWSLELSPEKNAYVVRSVGPIQTP